MPSRSISSWFLLGICACSDPAENFTPAPSGTSGSAAGSAGAAVSSGGSSGAPAAVGGGGSAGAGGAPLASGGQAGSAGSAAGTAGTGGATEPPLAGPFNLLVFSLTEGFRHDSIPAGIELIATLGAEHDFTVEASEDASIFNDASLETFAAVVFLQTSGDVLDVEQRAAFERYIEAGGGFVGVHCASCGGEDWPWYGELLGAYFSGHPAIQDVTVLVENHDHPSTAELPDVWMHNEEPYNFEMNPRGAVTVLATLDEASYTGGTMGEDHPIMWYHDFQGGRSWYTALGHRIEAYSDELFIKCLLGGIEYAAGRKP